MAQKFNLYPAVKVELLGLVSGSAGLKFSQCTLMLVSWRTALLGFVGL